MGFVRMTPYQPTIVALTALTAFTVFEGCPGKESPVTGTSKTEVAAAVPAAKPRAAACPVIPLRLMMNTGDSSPRAILTLDADGTLHTPLQPGEPVARLDPRGCVSSKDGVWVEMRRQGVRPFDM